MSTPQIVLRLEGLCVLIASVVLFRHLGGHWTIFALLFLTPDISMLGYLVNKRLGSITYNAVHSYALVLALGLFAAATGRIAWLPWVAILSAHIGFDRLLGYGLKYAVDFRATHLQRV